MNTDELEREIEALKSDQLAFDQERQALEKRIEELRINWHRLGGAIIAYQKVLERTKVPTTEPISA